MKKDSNIKIRAWMNETKKLNDTEKTLHVIFDAIMGRDPKATAYIAFDAEGKSIKATYATWKKQCLDTAERLSPILKDTDFESVVALKLRNCPEWAILYWAIVMTGHTPILIDARLPKKNTDNLLRQSKAVAIITEDAEEFLAPAYAPEAIFNGEVEQNFVPNWGNKTIFCSSGTTGDAKMMVYEGHNIAAQIVASLSIPDNTDDLMYPSQINVLAMLPLHHIYGFMVVFMWFTYYGKTMVFPASIATNDLLHACREGKCTHVFSVPMLWDGIAQSVTRMVSSSKPSVRDMFAKMVAYNNNRISKKEAGLAATGFIRKKFQKKIIGSNVRFAISGGGYLSPKTQATVNGLGYPLYNGYGMTEVGIASVDQSTDVANRLKGSIGRPFYGVEYKIDVKGTTEEGAEYGELMVRSGIVHEYEIIGGEWKKTETEDGFFRTGDIATSDEQGNIYLKGRIKDTIILNNGENVYPDEIEFYFKGVANVKNVVCLGAKKPGEADESITLVCEVDPSIDEETIKKIHSDIHDINTTLANEKKVQWVLVDKTPLPVSGSMKVKRFAIKKAIESGSTDFVDAEGPKKNVVSFEGYDPKLVEEVKAKVTAVFASILMLPEDKVGENAVWTVDLGGDSMSYIEMCQTLDKEFGITIPEAVYGTIGCVNEFAKQVLDLLPTSSKPKKAKKSRK